LSDDGEALWVEIVSRQQEVLARHRVQCGAQSGEVRIGRGYDNDVILDDPYVAAHHVRIVRDETGALVAEDLGSANGLFAGEDRRRLARVVLDGKRWIRVGRTHLRIRRADQAVAPERLLRPHARSWPLVLGVACAVLGVQLLTTWLRETGEPKPGAYLMQLVSLGAFALVWTAAWTILSRIFSGQARFERHLLIAVGGLLVFALFNELTSYGAFAFSWRWLIAYRYVGTWPLAAAICFLHLREMGRSRESGRSRLKLKAAAVAALALVAIGMQTLSQWEASATTDRQSFVRGLKPPTLRVAAPQTAKVFFSEVASLKVRLDRERSETPAQGGSDAGSDDDD
jgi:hypothetical protein